MVYRHNLLIVTGIFMLLPGLNAAAEVTQVTLKIPMICCRTCSVTIGQELHRQPWVKNFEVTPGTVLVRIRPRPMSEVDLPPLIAALQGHGFAIQEVFVDLKGQLAGSPEGAVVISTETQQAFPLEENEPLERLRARLPEADAEALLRVRVKNPDSQAPLTYALEAAFPVGDTPGGSRVQPP
jgi:hypothetical protein